MGAARHDGRRASSAPRQPEGRGCARSRHLAQRIGGHRQDPGAHRTRVPAPNRRQRAGEFAVPDFYEGRRGGNGQPHQCPACRLGSHEARASGRRSQGHRRAFRPGGSGQGAAVVCQGTGRARRGAAHPDDPQLLPDPADGISRRGRPGAGLHAAGGARSDAAPARGAGRSGERGHFGRAQLAD